MEMIRLFVISCDHGSPNGRSSRDPMLCLMAIIGDEKAAGYKKVCGKASVDAQTGENSFIQDPQGIHCYVIKTETDSYHSDMINSFIV